MKASRKSLFKKYKKYPNGGVTPELPASGPELTFPADVYQGQENLTGSFPTGTPLVTTNPVQFPGLQSKQLEQTPIDTELSGPTMDQITVTPTEKPENLTEESTPDKQKQKDYNSMFTLGLGIGSAFINKGQDQRNRRMLNQSIQQRQTKPVYDYNYLWTYYYRRFTISANNKSRNGCSNNKQI